MMKLKGIACLNCGKKTLSYPPHLNVMGWKDYSHIVCRSCKSKFREKKRMEKNTEGEAMSYRVMSDAELRAIAERVNEATPRPWEVVQGEDDCGPMRFVCMSGGEDSTVLSPANADFIAAARADIPILIANIACYRAICRRLVACYDGEDDLFSLCCEVRKMLKDDEKEGTT